MKNPRTTIAGMVAAGALAATNIEGLPPKLYPWLKVIAAVAMAILGYAAQDCPKDCPGNKAKTAAAVLLVVLLVLLPGCATGGFGLKVGSPAFGSVELDVGGVAIGRPSVPKNATTLAQAPPKGQ